MGECMKGTENHTWHTVSPAWLSFVINLEAFYSSFPTDGVKTQPFLLQSKKQSQTGLTEPPALLSKMPFPRYADHPPSLPKRWGPVFYPNPGSKRVCLSCSKMISLFSKDT